MMQQILLPEGSEAPVLRNIEGYGTRGSIVTEDEKPLSLQRATQERNTRACVLLLF